MATRPLHYSDRESAQHLLLRWSLAGLCTVVLYGAVIYAALYWPGQAMPASNLPAAVMIELAPQPVAPDTPQENVAVGHQMMMLQATMPSQPETQVDTPDAEAEPETKADIPEVPDNAKAEVVLAKPPPPEAEKPIDDKRKQEKPKKRSKSTQPRNAQNAPATSAPQPADLQRAAVNAAATAGMSSSASPATWRSMIMAHLNRHKRAAHGGARGTAMVVFTIDRSGRVLSARLVGSSGDPSLDQEAVAIARRASPVPAPPANIGGGVSIPLSVPVRFGS